MERDFEVTAQSMREQANDVTILLKHIYKIIREEAKESGIILRYGIESITSDALKTVFNSLISNGFGVVATYYDQETGEDIKLGELDIKALTNEDFTDGLQLEILW